MPVVRAFASLGGSFYRGLAAQCARSIVDKGAREDALAELAHR